MSNPVTVYVLDTSAWLTLIEDELGADIVQRLLEDTQAGQAVVLTSLHELNGGLLCHDPRTW